MKNKALEERISIILADIIARFIYAAALFLITFFSFYGGYSRSAHTADLYSAESFYIVLFICIAASLLGALLGPYAYQKIAHHGRGTLNDVKEASKGPNQGYKKR